MLGRLIFLGYGIILVISSFRLGVFSEISATANQPVNFEQILKSPGADWLTYGGDYASRRFSPLSNINQGNIADLQLRWTYQVEKEESNLRATPLVYDGVMYITNAYEIEALDAGSGKRLWFWRAEQYPRQWMNRGAALLGDKVFFITLDCTLTALDRKTGQLRWRQKFVDDKSPYHCTVAPLALKDRLIVGVSGGSDGVRGFLAALRERDGKELWRFWIIPEKGDLKGGAATWTTGSYDPELNLLYWATGNPWPDFDGRSRPGDNLYSDSVLALNPENGDLKWYFQFTPHDIHGWDANEPLVLVDLVWQGKPRKLLLQANRNGFFYVLDRKTGQFLLGRPFVEKLNWADGFSTKGRPIFDYQLNQGWVTGEQTCPGLTGATNWMPSSYNPVSDLFYVNVLESCDMEAGRRYLRAIDSHSGSVRWEYEMPGPNHIYAGILSMAGGLVFSGRDDRHFMVLDALNGRLLWEYDLGQLVFASPITYVANGRQYVTIAAGPKVFTFGLPD